jgi:hypothetical protein
MSFWPRWSRGSQVRRWEPARSTNPVSHGSTPSPTAASARIASGGALRGGSRRCRAPGSVRAPPAGLGPPHYDSILTVGNVARRGAHLTLHRRGEHPDDGHAAAVSLAVTACTHTRPIGLALDMLDPYAWQSNNNLVPSDRALGFLPSPECFATFRLRKAKRLQLQRRALCERIHNCPLKIEQPSWVIQSRKASPP